VITNYTTEPVDEENAAINTYIDSTRVEARVSVKLTHQYVSFWIGTRIVPDSISLLS
jgi:hypothetical protein